MSEKPAIDEVTEEPRRSVPGERLYEGARRVLFLCFFAIFILTAHQHLFAGHRRSKAKLIILMCLAPIILLCGLGSAIGWWQMRRAGAFDRRHEHEPDERKPERKPERKQEKREKRKERRDGPELLPWQRRDRR